MTAKVKIFKSNSTKYLEQDINEFISKIHKIASIQTCVVDKEYIVTILYEVFDA